MTDPEDRDNDTYAENATFKERMVWYVSRDQEDKAKALVQLLTQLESNLEWEISIFVEDRLMTHQPLKNPVKVNSYHSSVALLDYEKLNSQVLALSAFKVAVGGDAPIRCFKSSALSRPTWLSSARHGKGHRHGTVQLQPNDQVVRPQKIDGSPGLCLIKIDTPKYWKQNV